ncbi:MAG: hypothetical protein HOO86_10705 [Bacteroidales bacterium]|nr:hypothetical protein [Bacteroidales bacterium]
MTRKEKELEEEISKIWNILIYVKDCYDYSYYIHKPETSEEADYLKNSQDFEFIRHILWRMAIIEIAKLFCNSAKRDRYNLRHFISKLKKAGQFGDSGINVTTIEKWEAQFSLNEVLINDVITIRDKVYAHTDPNKEEYTKIEISFKKIDDLINIAEDVIREIFKTVFDSEVDFDSPLLDKNRNNIIKILAAEKRNRIEELALKYRNEK